MKMNMRVLVLSLMKVKVIGTNDTTSTSVCDRVKGAKDTSSTSVAAEVKGTKNTNDETNRCSNLDAEQEIELTELVHSFSLIHAWFAT